MNLKKLQFVLGLGLVLATLAAIVTPVVMARMNSIQESRSLPARAPAATPPPDEIRIVAFSVEDAGNGSRSLTDNVGMFPGVRFTYSIAMGPVYYQEEARPFYIDAAYPYPYTELYQILGPYGQYIASCVHQGHKVHCTGTIPAGDPETLVDPSSFDFFFVLEGTCSLYTDPQTTISIVPSSNLAPGIPYEETVEPILDLTAIAESPADGEKEVFIESSHQGPLLKWHDQTGGYVCGDGSDLLTQDIFYAAYIQQQGKQAQKVGDQVGECSRQIQLSEDDLSCLDDGDPAPWTWTVTAVDIKYSPCVDPLLKKDNDFQFTTASCRPEVSPIEPRYGAQYFLNNIGVENVYRVEVDWNGEAYQTPVETQPYGKVHFEINGTETPVDGVEGQEWGAEHSLDMGADFQAGWSGGNNILNIWATYRPDWAAQDIESLYQTSQPVVYPFPEWATTLPVGPFTVNAKEGAVEYENTVVYPEEAFNANVTVPGWIPYLGGRKLGILDTQAEGGIEASSAGEGKLGLEGETGLGMGGFDILGQVGGEGLFKFLNGDGLKMVKSTFALAVSTPFEKEMTLADLIPGIKAAEEWWFVGDLIKKVTRATKITGQLIPKVGVSADFKQQGHDQWVFEGSVGRGEMAVKVRAEIKPYENIWVAVYGGGTPFVELNFPANPDYLNRVGIDMVFGAALHAWRWEANYEYAVTCSLPEGSCYESDDEAGLMMLPARDSADDWALMGRDYAAADYNTFVVGAPTLSASGVSAASATAETPLITNVYPLTEPALAGRADGRRTLLYVHDDDAKPLGQGEEIVAAQWNGLNWTAPVTLTDDLRLDFSPQVVYDGAGNAVAVWERTHTEAVTSGLNITFAQQLDIGAMTWYSATGTWDSSPAMLTDNNSLADYAPRLRSGYDGSVLALWQSSDGVSIMGAADHPVTYTYATWNGAWSAVTPAIGGLTNTLGMDVAVYSATQAALVYAVDTDGVLTTTADTELFYSLYDGVGWDGPTRLTTDAINNAITDTSPALVYDAGGALKLLWRRGDDVVMLDGSLDVADVQLVRPGSTAAGFLDFTLACSPQGHLALIWQAVHDDLVDLAYAVYDDSAGGWGADQYLTSDDAVEAALSPAFASDGTLHLAYRKSQTEYITETFDISPTLTITVTDLPSRGRSDLYVLSHTIGRDLAVDSLVITPTRPAAGDIVTLTAQARNVGDLETGPVIVRFSDGATTIISYTVAPTLTAGTSITATTAWTAPSTITEPHTLQATVDPAGAIAEADETNNAAELTVFGPRLAADWAARTHDTTTITYTLYSINEGGSPAQAPISVTLRTGAPDGDVIASSIIASDVAAGERVSATVIVDNLSLLDGLGDDGWLAAGDPTGDHANAWPVALGLWPDLTISAADIQVSDQVSVTLHNAGVITATDVVLAVRQDGLTGALVYSDTLGDVGPGSSLSLATALVAPSEEMELWAQVDPDDLVAESSESNNLAVRKVTILHYVYLPLVLRQYP